MPLVASASVKSVTETDTGCNIGKKNSTRVDETDLYGQTIDRFYVPRNMYITFTLNSTIEESYFYKLALYDSESEMIFLNLNYSSDDVNASTYDEFFKGDWKRDTVSDTATFTYTVKLTKGYYYFLIGKSDILKKDTFFLSSFDLQYPKGHLSAFYCNS